MTGQMRITFKIHITFNNMTKPWHSRKKQTGKMIQDYRHILEELPLVNHDLRESILYYWLENKLIVFLYLYFQVRNEQSFQITFNNMTKHEIPEKQTGKTIQDYRHILEELPLVNQLLRFANNKVISPSFCKCK